MLITVTMSKANRFNRNRSAFICNPSACYAVFGRVCSCLIVFGRNRTAIWRLLRNCTAMGLVRTHLPCWNSADEGVAE